MIPTNHPGAIYTDVMRHLSVARRSKVYLEVGVNSGNLLQHIKAELAIGVDPNFMLTHNIMDGKAAVALCQETSDEFFRSHRAADLAGKIDLAFLDGLHVFEYLLRDFANTERLCTKNALIVMHDCLPLNVEMAHRNIAYSVSIGQASAYPNYWTGDVWKIVPLLRQVRPDLRIHCLDAPPTGLVCVTNLDPTSHVIDDRYCELVDRYLHLPNTTDAIAAMYAEIQLRSTASVMTDEDHSLLFRL